MKKKYFNIVFDFGLYNGIECVTIRQVTLKPLLELKYVICGSKSKISSNLAF